MVGTQVRVGTIRVERIHQGTIVATVVSDGLAPKKTINVQPHEKFMVAILAGDIARIDEVPKKVVKTRKAVGPKNIKQLRKERDALVRALRRKARKPKPFRRRVMKWDL